MRQKRVSCDAAKHSDEVGETPVRDSGLAEVSHLDRACAEAYHDEDECSGGFGAEDRSLVWPAVSGGALRRWRCGRAATAAALASGGRRGEWGGDRMEWPGSAGWRPDRDKAGRPRCVHDADIRPPRGRRRVYEGGRPRAGERGRGNRAALSGWAEREAGRPSSACPLFFFLKLFSQKTSMRLLKLLQIFFRGWSKKKNCSPQNSLQLFFNKQS